MKISSVSVGLAVRSAREAAEMTLATLSTVTGISTSGLSRLESGQRSLNFIEAAAIADAVKIDVGTLRLLAETFQPGAEERAAKESQLKSDLKALQRVAIETAIALRTAPEAETMD